MNSRNFLWLAPFLSFILGYFFVQSYFGASTTQVPAVVGSSLYEAVRLLSVASLYPRIVTEKEEPDVPVGTILQQKPEAGARVRCNQPVMLVVAKGAEQIVTPHVTGQSVDAVVQELTARGLRAQVYDLDAQLPQGVCLAQWPSANQEIKPKESIILYRAATEAKPYLMPDVRGKTVAQVHELCEKYPVTCQIIHSVPVECGHACTYCSVQDQRPLPGTLVTLNQAKQLLLQLQV